MNYSITAVKNDVELWQVFVLLNGDIVRKSPVIGLTAVTAELFKAAEYIKREIKDEILGQINL